MWPWKKWPKIKGFHWGWNNTTKYVEFYNPFLQLVFWAHFVAPFLVSLFCFEIFQISPSSVPRKRETSNPIPISPNNHLCDKPIQGLFGFSGFVRLFLRDVVHVFGTMEWYIFFNWYLREAIGWWIQNWKSLKPFFGARIYRLIAT